MNTPSPPPATDLQPLVCHAATPSSAVRTLAVHLTPLADGGLRLHYVLHGDIARLRIPEPTAAPGHRDGLWEHTCFEAFIARSGGTAYREYNFSPSGAWAIFSFAGYRQPEQPLETASASSPENLPRVVANRSAGRLELEATLPPLAVPEGNTPLEIGFSAVIEAADIVEGRHSYWALAHTAARPDFHRREAFTLVLDR